MNNGMQKPRMTACPLTGCEVSILRRLLLVERMKTYASQDRADELQDALYRKLYEIDRSLNHDTGLGHGRL
jgi:hypothetical protein